MNVRRRRHRKSSAPSGSSEFLISKTGSDIWKLFELESVISPDIVLPRSGHGICLAWTKMKRMITVTAAARASGWWGLLACLVACGQVPGNRSSGAVGLGLQLSPGTTVSEAVYTIAGPNGFFSAGSVAVGESADLPVVLQNLPVGTGYELDVTATASDGQTNCDGNSTFDVVNANPMTVVVHLVCAVPSGDATVTATLNICPVIDNLSASPNDVRLGGTVALTSSAHDSDLGPSPLVYKWAVNGAPLKGPLQPNLNFACSTPGTFNFTLSVSDGDATPGCADNLSVVSRCSVP